ncbi:Conserved_hypothetical protein [Hexamita inflata]|uniref:Uncharacterized protein n=1 Tax=Hexamita inflata TaxID=28002 RepID=A0AA86UQV4_9EUKA|nr:Conserved hypothetical protein [Hexamita inflata]
MNAYISADIQFYMSTLSDLIDNLENISSLNYVLSSEINLLLSEIFITNFQVQPLQAECQLLLSQLQNVGAINKYDEDSYISFHPQLQFLFQTEFLSKPILFAFFLFQLAGLLDSKQHLDECKFASLGKYIIQGKQVLNVYSVQFSALLKDFYAQIPIQTIQCKIFKIRKQLEQEPNIICFHKLAKVLYRFMKGRVKTKDENEDQFLYCLVFKQLNSNTLTELFKEQTYVFNQISQIQNIWTKMDKQVIQQYENDTIIQKERITAEILIFEEELQIFKNETDSEEKRLFDRLIIQYKPHKLNRTIINNLLIKYGYKLYLNNCEYTKVYKQCEQDTFINDLILSLNGLDNAIKINNLQTLFCHQQIRDSFELIKKLVSNQKMRINLCQQPNIDRFLNQCVQLQLEDEVLKICAINIEQFSECYDLDAIIRNQLYMHKIVNRVKKPMLKLETSKIELQKIEEQKLEELKVQQQTLQQQKIEQQKLEKEQLKQHKLERLEQDKLEKLKLQQLKIEQQKLYTEILFYAFFLKIDVCGIACISKLLSIIVYIPQTFVILTRLQVHLVNVVQIYDTYYILFLTQFKLKQHPHLIKSTFHFNDLLKSVQGVIDYIFKKRLPQPINNNKCKQGQLNFSIPFKNQIAVYIGFPTQTKYSIPRYQHNQSQSVLSKFTCQSINKYKTPLSHLESCCSSNNYNLLNILGSNQVKHNTNTILLNTVNYIYTTQHNNHIYLST